MNRPDQNRHRNFDQVQFEELLSAGIAALKGGDRQQARQLFTRVVEIKSSDPRPWLWLSGTTDDPQEQRDYLENALAADPNNSAARRGLVLLSEKLDQERLLAEGQGVAPRQPSEPEEAVPAVTFLCPQCGGHMFFDARLHNLTCEYCGFVQVTEQQKPAETAQQTLDFVLPTTRGHRWAEAQHRLTCEQCGAVTLMPEGQKALNCPYCGSRQLIESGETTELVDPQAIGLFKIDQQEAARRIKQWLLSGTFIPDDLRKKVRSSTLRAAYYPFWSFDGTLEMHWSCEVNEGTGRNPHWISQSGAAYDNFDDVLVPGFRALDREQLSTIEPFDLEDIVDFKSEYLAGWNAIAYDVSLADASLKAREKVAHQLRRDLPDRVLIGLQKRNLQSGGLNWSGMIFTHLLLPIWVGAYRYKNNTYRVLVNGQTGKAGGERPRDPLKLLGIIAFVTISLVLILFVLIVFAIRVDLIRF